MCQKSSRDIIKKLHRNHLTNGQNAIAEKKLECPVESNCQVNDVIYKYDVTRPLSKKVFLGLAEGEWKSRLYNHKLLLKKKKTSSNETTLSSYILHWKSVSSEIYNLKWSVLRCVPPYSKISKK